MHCEHECHHSNGGKCASCDCLNCEHDIQEAVDKLEGVRMEALLSHIASIFNYRLTSRKYGRGSAHREELSQLIQNLKKDKYLQ